MASIARRDYGRWRARYRDDEGREHARHFRRRQDAQRWLDEVTTAVVAGQYVDPKAGRITFTSFYRVRHAAGLGVDDREGDGPVRSHGHLRGRSDEPAASLAPRAVGQDHDGCGLKPGTIRTRTNNVRAVLRGAVRDRVIALDPSQGLALPRVGKPEHCMTVASPRQVRAILDAADDRFVVLFALGAFAGLRLGEAAGVQVGDIDFLHRSLRVGARSSALGEARWRSGRPSTAASGSSTCPTSCWPSSRCTSRDAEVTSRTPGCSRPPVATRHTRTQSGTSGAEPADERASAA